MTTTPAPTFPTFLFTDIEGSTKAARRIPYQDYKEQLLQPQFNEFSRLIQQHNGAEPGTPAGDSVLAVFEKAVDAVHCAVEMQKVMPTIRYRDQNGNETALKARIGIHTAKQLIGPDDYLNHPEVIFAARLVAIINGGQIIFSQATREAAGVIDYGVKIWHSRRIKKWEEAPEDVYEVLYDDVERPEPGFIAMPKWFHEFNRYIPRPELEEEILSLFTRKMPDGPNNRLVTLRGAGGTGKTRLGEQCCLRAAGLFEGNIYIVRLESPGGNTLPEGQGRLEFITGRIAEALGISINGLTPEKLPHCLPYNKKLLLMLDSFEMVDGMDTRKWVSEMLATRPLLHILTTSREQLQILNIGLDKEIGSMEQEGARRLLLARIEDRLSAGHWKKSVADNGAIERLLETTACIPLALELVAARAGEMTLKEIASGLETAVPRDITEETGRYRSLERCLSWSWNLLPEDVQQTLIRLCLFAERCPYEEIRECFPEVTRECLGVLESASLISRMEEKKVSLYSLLNPIRRFALDRLGDIDADEAICRQFVDHYTKLTKDSRSVEKLENPVKQGALERAWRHAAAAAEIAATRKDIDSCTSIVTGLVRFCQRQKVCSDSRLLFELAVDVSRVTYPEGHAYIADNLISLALLYNSQARYAQAEQLYKEGLVIYRSALPETHSKIATSLICLADLLHLEKRYSEAEPIYKEALAIYAAHTKKDPNIATSLNNLAELYRVQKRFSEAEPLHKEALAIYRTAFPEGHLFTANCLQNLAELYKSQERYSEAEVIYKEALTIYRTSLSEKHLTIANCLNGIALLYGSQGRYREAEPLCKEVLAIRQAALPEKHPDIASSLNHLAMLCKSQGRYSEAEPLYREALAIRQVALRENDPLIADSLNSLALFCNSQGKYGEAMRLYRKSVAIYRIAFPEGHSYLANCLSNLADLYRHLGDYDEAEPLCKEALAINRTSLPEGHSSIATGLNNLALLYRNMKRYDEAEPLFKEAVTMSLFALGPNHPNTVINLSNYRELLMTQERQDDFMEFLGEFPVLRETYQIVLSQNRRNE